MQEGKVEIDITMFKCQNV